MPSLSARRAWIEIERPLWRPWQQRVALRKESVDRNIIDNNLVDRHAQSLSARRAWIEMRCGRLQVVY